MQRDEIIPKTFPVELLNKDWSQRKCFFKKGCKEYFSKIYDFEVREDDVWIITLPKCGTTWMQELVWLLLNNFDFETALQVDLELRTPFLEFDLLINNDLETALDSAKNLKSPRLIKSHLPLPLLPKQLWEKKPKVIYVYRNPIDAIVSIHHHNQAMGHSDHETLEEYAKWYYTENATTLKPFDHVAEFYALRNEKWVLYTSFERMKKDLRSVILEICRFLRKAISEELLTKMLKHLSFEEMKNNPMVQHNWEYSQACAKFNVPCKEKPRFVRKGKVNGYKEELSPAIIDTLNAWIDNELKKHNLTLDELLLTNNN